MIPLGPKWLPLINERLHAETAETANLMTRTAADKPVLAEYAGVLSRMTTRMGSAGLWWIRPDMSMLAAHTAEDHDGFDGRTDAEPPERDGLIVWEGGLPLEMRQPFGMPAARVTAVHWSVDDGPVRLLIYTDEPHMTRLHADRRLPLALIGYDDGIHGVDMRGDESRVWLRRVLAATWALSRQPFTHERDATWNERSQGLMPRALGKAMRRRPASPIRLLDVNTMPADDTASGARPHEDREREYSCRWIVSGHYRNQPYGPGRTQHRRIWIAPYIAGPKDKPLIIKPVVHIWRNH